MLCLHLEADVFCDHRFYRFSVTTNVPDFNHHKDTKHTKHFKTFFLCAFVVSSRTTLVVTIFFDGFLHLLWKSVRICG